MSRVKITCKSYMSATNTEPKAREHESREDDLQAIYECNEYRAEGEVA